MSIEIQIKEICRDYSVIKENMLNKKLQEIRALDTTPVGEKKPDEVRAKIAYGEARATWEMLCVYKPRASEFAGFDITSRDSINSTISQLCSSDFEVEEFISRIRELFGTKISAQDPYINMGLSEEEASLAREVDKQLSAINRAESKFLENPGKSQSEKLEMRIESNGKRAKLLAAQTIPVRISLLSFNELSFEIKMMFLQKEHTKQERVKERIKFVNEIKTLWIAEYRKSPSKFSLDGKVLGIPSSTKV